MIFGYQRNPFGQWSPAKWHDGQPSSKKAEGGSHEIYIAKTLDAAEDSLTLAELETLYPAPAFSPTFGGSEQPPDEDQTNAG